MDLARLLRPKTIAVIGGKPAAEVIRQNDRLGFTGQIWPVHPLRSEIESRSTFASPDALPDGPDAVFLAVNRHACIDIVANLALRGAGGVVCYASGFAETDKAGETLQQRLVEAAGDMPLLGPNCYGLLNYLDGVALWPDQHGGERVERGVAIVTQSGNIGCNLTMQRRGLPIAYLATLGNQAAVGLSHMIEALAADPRVTAIGLHIEGFDDPAAFARAASASRVPIVVVKTGTSAAGAAITISHTASLAGADAVADAFFRRLGVGRVHTLPALLETLKLLHVHGRLESAEIVSLSCSGGEAALIADRAEHTTVRLRAFTQAQREAVAATVPALVTVSNPFDYHTFHWANREALAATFTAVMRAGFALSVLILDFPRESRCIETDWVAAADALADACAATGGRAAIVATLPECLSEARAVALMGQGIAPLYGIDEALAAIAVAAQIEPASPMHASVAPPSGTVRTLDEAEAKGLLARYGVPIPVGHATSAASDVAAPSYPAVVKALGIAHKTECHAVRLGLADAASVARAARELEPLGSGLLVEEMVHGIAEIIVGVARDAVLGPYLLIGSGGVLAELIGDRAILMLPAARDEIARAITGLKVAALLAGYRGRPAGDVSAAIDAILAIQSFALAHLDRLVELDINPLIVTPDRAVATDALIRLTEVA